TRPHEGARGGALAVVGVADLTTSREGLVPAICIAIPPPPRAYARDLRKNVVTTVPARPVRYVSETADHTRVPLSTGMPDCDSYATVRSSTYLLSRAKTTTLLR